MGTRRRSGIVGKGSQNNLVIPRLILMIRMHLNFYTFIDSFLP